MSRSSNELIKLSGYARPGFADTYDQHRPRPPGVLLDLLARIAGVERPGLVVDLGSGTGLSARAWAGRAGAVVGIEPNAAMLARAEQQTVAENVRYVLAFAGDTGLPEARADIVTCAQSFHWMEPEPVLAEAAHILRTGGVFAAYDYELPPVVHWEVDAAFDAYHRARWLARRRRGIKMGSDRRPKEGHLDRIRESGHFRFAREVLCHSAEQGDAERVVGLARSIGPGFEDEDIENALGHLADVAARVVGERSVEWHFGYRIRLGVR